MDPLCLASAVNMKALIALQESQAVLLGCASFTWRYERDLSEIVQRKRKTEERRVPKRSSTSSDIGH